MNVELLLRLAVTVIECCGLFSGIKLYVRSSFVISASSTADTCKNCAKCGKGLKIGKNEACNIKIKICIVGILKIFC